jgi:WW domain-containing oxidoreductase
MDPGGLPASRSQKDQRKPIQLMMGALKVPMPVLKHFTSALRPTADAARDLVAVAVEPEFEGMRGYFIGLKPDVDAEISRDIEAQKRLWAACWKWTSLTPGETILSNAAA